MVYIHNSTNHLISRLLPLQATAWKGSCLWAKVFPNAALSFYMSQFKKEKIYLPQHDVMEGRKLGLESETCLIGK